TQTEPANPDYNPALVHAELNPTGSIQKQMELNAYFHSPNPDIQASLISELNPTGSLKKQADLNNYFASLAKTAPGAPTAVATTTYSTLPHNELNKTTDKTGNSTMNRPSTIASTTSTQPASWSPYNAPVAASGIIATDQNLAPATITLTDKNGVSRTAAINSPEAIHVGSGGTWQDLDTVSAIYSRGNATEIANWERFSGSKPPAGGYTASNSADPYTPASTVAYTTDN
ncbi:hypothetical protein KBB49_02795, partial [Candidatus Saccharibacteria bacterium]|nr:hypothetical protein [Candidatus Saccharibacteria bacterium]